MKTNFLMTIFLMTSLLILVSCEPPTEPETKIDNNILETDVLSITASEKGAFNYMYTTYNFILQNDDYNENDPDEMVVVNRTSTHRIKVTLKRDVGLLILYLDDGDTLFITPSMFFNSSDTKMNINAFKKNSEYYVYPSSLSSPLLSGIPDTITITNITASFFDDNGDDVNNAELVNKDITFEEVE